MTFQRLLLLLGGRVSDLIGRRRAFIIGLVGFAVASAVGGLLTESFGWRWNLYINIPILVVAIVGAVIFVPRIARGPRPRLDILGAVLVSGALFCLVYRFSHAESDGWGAVSTWGVLAASEVLLVSFVAWVSRAAHPLLPLSVVTNRVRGAAYIAIFVEAIGMFASSCSWSTTCRRDWGTRPSRRDCRSCR